MFAKTSSVSFGIIRGKLGDDNDDDDDTAKS